MGSSQRRNPQSESPTPCRPSRHWLRWTISVTLCALVFILAWYWWVIFRPMVPGQTERLVVTVSRGGFHNTVTSFVQQGLLDHPLFFEIHGTLVGARRHVRVGAYFVDPGMSAHGFLQHIITGDNRAIYRVQLPEGLNVWQVAQRFERAGATTAAEFVDRCYDWGWAHAQNLPTRRPTSDRFPGRDLSKIPALEGVLFPSTYEFVWGSSTDDMVLTLVQQFQKEWTQLSQQHAETKQKIQTEFGFDDHDFITLASLVEKEVQRAEERPIVASVFYNRLRESMKLQTDPTLVYSAEHYAEKPTPTHRKDSTNPYNTYAYPGLPPGPIANPGRESLRAVLSPATTDFLYFVAAHDGSGAHVFTRTFEEHKQAIRGTP